MTTVQPLARFRAMVVMRQFEEACIKGAMAREIHGELHAGIGQEAIAAGMIGALQVEDALVSTHRNHLHAIAKGVPLRPLMAEIFERETGLCKGRGGHMHPFDPLRKFSATGIVGSSIPVALGYAYAFWLEGQPSVAVAITGEGGSNAGAFHECMNIAAAWKLPFVLLVENNFYAISVRYDEVMATPTIAERAAAYGAWGRKVDGTDVDAVAAAFAEATAHARQGDGPALLEATCYRFRGHYEGDHDGYRSREDRDRMKKENDPIVLYRKRLLDNKIATEAQLNRVDEEAKQEISTIVAAVRSDRLPPASEAMKYRFVGAAR
jgi:acetoin:2,6-dichlorophenolindophenol oxidoreductase subunit alpha